MIEREQISEALGRLDPRDREVLDYSLRRRVPDEDLATIFSSTAAELARRRAGAIETLSADLGVQRGSDLGHMLKALLEAETWDAVPSDARPPGDHGPVGASPTDPEERVEHRPLGAIANPPAEAVCRGAGRRALIGLGAAIAVLAPAGVVYALTAGDDGSARTTGSGTRDFAPLSDGAGEPFPSDPQSAGQYPTARITQRTPLYDQPNGKVVLRVAPKTEWDSPRVLGVAERRGKWLAVMVPELKNGKRAWVRDDRVAGISSVSWALDVDLSRRRLAVMHDGKVVRRMRIGVGRRDHPTPVGRYAVTDKLRVSDPSSPYGCCVLALTGHQTRLPEGWPGGDRLAVHATKDLSGLGKRVSLGCMRTDPRDTRWMLKRIPLGAPVFISS